MKLDDRTIAELADQLGISADKKSAADAVKSYEKKSDAELVSEMMKIRDRLAANNISYEKQIAAVKSLMPMMNSEQKARLTKIIGLLEK